MEAVWISGLDGRYTEEDGKQGLIPSGFQPVSYTHLDVYKRQSRGKASIMGPAVLLCLSGLVLSKKWS